jgi:putative nucleotidyltransferase with HDIG domain
LRYILYRLRQFQRARRETPSQAGLAQAEAVLPPALFDLFERLLPFEQAHAIRVYDGLVALGEDDPDLLAAGLLHDVGKARQPLRPWERALAVAAKKVLPDKFMQWGQGEPSGLRVGIVVAARHAQWGAEMSAEAGASERLVRLIRHHDAELSQIPEPDRPLIEALQSVDAVS